MSDLIHRIREGVRRVRGRLGDSQGVVTVGVAFAVTVGLVAAVGTGLNQTGLDMLDPNTWLTNDTTASVTHVTTDGEADARIRFAGLEGHDLEVVQGSAGTYVVDHTTNTLYRLDTANLDGATASVDLGANTDIVVGHSAAYIIVRHECAATTVEPITLQRTADPVGIDPVCTRGVLDTDETLWTATNQSGEALAVTGDTITARVGSGGAGHDLDLATAAGRPVVIDHTTASVTRIHPDHSTDTAPLGVAPGGRPAQVQRDNPDSTLRLVDPDTATYVRVDLDTKAVSAPLPLGRDGNDLGEPTHLGGHTYIADNTAGDVVVVDDTKDKILDPIPIRPPTGGSGTTSPGKAKGDAIEIERRGDTVYINDPTSDTAVAVDKHHNHKKINKGAKNVPTNDKPTPEDPQPDNTPPATPTPKPQTKKPTKPKPVPGQVATTTTSPPSSTEGTDPVPEEVGTVREVTAEENGDGTVTLTWDAPDGAEPSGYAIEATSSSGNPARTYVSTAPTYTTPSPESAQALGLDDDADADYTFTVTANATDGRTGAASPPSNRVDPATGPSDVEVSLARIPDGPRRLEVTVAAPQWRGTVGTLVVEVSGQPVSIPPTGGKDSIDVAWDSTSRAVARACVGKLCEEATSSAVSVLRPTFSMDYVVLEHCVSDPNPSGDSTLGDKWQAPAHYDRKGLDPRWETRAAAFGYGTASHTVGWSSDQLLHGGWVSARGRSWWVQGWVDIVDLGRLSDRYDGVEPAC